MGVVPRIGFRRTQAVDDMLKGIWELRPELERKNTTTILLGLESFLRECKARAQTGHLPDAIDSVSDEEAIMAELEPVAEVKESTAISDDIEW